MLHWIDVLLISHSTSLYSCNHNECHTACIYLAKEYLVENRDTLSDMSTRLSKNVPSTGPLACMWCPDDHVVGHVN